MPVTKKRITGRNIHATKMKTNQINSQWHGLKNKRIIFTESRNYRLRRHLQKAAFCYSETENTSIQ